MAKTTRRGDATLRELGLAAAGCRTPRQFRELLDRLQTSLPYRHLVCGWGHPGDHAIGFIFNHSYPRDFMRWFLSRGMLRKGPMFREWIRERRPQVMADVYKRRAASPEQLATLERYHLTHTLGGGSLGRHQWVYFSVSMASEEDCRASLEQFRAVLPMLSRALKRACPRPLLTAQETDILERRAMGESLKQIAAALDIAERTVRMHLQGIKKKLYTDDLVNAVVIAVRSGLLDETWRELRWRGPRRRPGAAEPGSEPGTPGPT